MFTWLWTKQFSRLNQRLQSLEVAREENLLSPDLSAQTLQVAPDFWERQHQAFSYVDKQMRKLSRRSKIWGGMALLAVLADAALVVAGLAAFQSWQQVQADRHLTRIANQAADPVQRAFDDLVAQLPQMSETERYRALEALQALSAISMAGSGYSYGSSSGISVYSSAPTVAATPLEAQLQTIYQLGQMRAVEAVPALLTKLADGEPVVREAAARALGQIGDPRALDPLHDLLAYEPNELVQDAAIAAIAQLLR
ncbi:HEAT repeat domain-containing protein [Synechococcus sp. H55.11]|uniref:HEAT repeat domain-containing protein n=1 Tax=Synechococcus sp. H55.11 TaxID=2967121 RepID=UPI0039C056F8